MKNTMRNAYMNQNLIENISIINAVQTPLLLVSQPGVIVGINQSAEILFGYSQTEILGKHLQYLIPNNFLEGLFNLTLNPSLKGSEKLIIANNQKTVGQNKAGELLHLQIGAKSIEYENEFLTLITASDLTERKHTEDILRLAIQELERNNQALQEFVYMVSHDLRSPLSSIQGLINILQRRHEKKSNQVKDNDLIKDIIYTTEYMQALIENLLIYSKVEFKKVEFQSVSLHDVLIEALDLLKYMIEQSNAKVIIEPGLPEVMGDFQQLLRLFHNLIENGIKYNENKKPLIRVSFNKKAEDWVINMHDNGIGIDFKEQDFVFQMFNRLNHKKTVAGTGIGLAICKRIVDYHQGKIWIESTLGQGSIFCFSLPEKKL